MDIGDDEDLMNAYKHAPRKDNKINMKVKVNKD